MTDARDDRLADEEYERRRVWAARDHRNGIARCRRDCSCPRVRAIAYQPEIPAWTACVCSAAQRCP